MKCIKCGLEMAIGTIMWHDYRIGDMHMKCKDLEGDEE